MNIKKIIALVSALLISNVVLGDAVNFNSQFFSPGLGIAAGVRPAGMGEAFLAVSDDVNAVTWNPAGMLLLKDAQAGLTYDRWLVDTYFQHLTAVYPFENTAVGMDLYYFSAGDIQGRDGSGVLTGEKVSAYDIGGGISFGFLGWDGLKTGLSLKFVRQNIGESYYFGVAADISVLIISSSAMSLALSVKNLGWSNSDVAPIGVRGGAAIKVLKDGTNDLLLALDNEIIISGLYTVCAGAEYTYASRYSVRAGYKYMAEQSSLAGLNGLSIGAGARIEDIRIDYSMAFGGDFGLTHRFSVLYDFGRLNKAAGPAAVVKPETGGSGKDLYSLGVTYEQAGEPVMAAQKYYDCLKQDPENAQAWKNLGMIYYKAGKKEEGYQCMKKYIVLKPDDAAIKDWLIKYEAFNKKP